MAHENSESVKTKMDLLILLLLLILSLILIIRFVFVKSARPGKKNKLIFFAAVILLVAEATVVVLPSFLNGTGRQEELVKSHIAKMNAGAMNRSIQAFYVDENRFPETFPELVNKFRGFNSSYIQGGILEELENSNMKFSGYEFNMRLVDRDTVHVSAIPLYKGSYSTISGGVFFDRSDMQAKGILCESEEFTSGSTDFPKRDASGQLTCPSGYEPSR